MMALTAGSDGSGRIFRRAGASLKLSASLSVGGGYDLDSGEVSGGIFLWAPVTAAFSCGIHPALGMTFSASAGTVR
jgi:hypothetical protein